MPCSSLTLAQKAKRLAALILVIGALALVGVVGTFAVAWMLAACNIAERGNVWDNSTLFLEPSRGWIVASGQCTGYAYVDVDLVSVVDGLPTGVLPAWTSVHLEYESSGGRATYQGLAVEECEIISMHESAFGWPLPCLSYTRVSYNSWCTDVDLHQIAVYSDNVHLEFPARPLLLNFAVDAVVFAAVASLPVCGCLAVRKVRREHRRQRGHCVWCGYDLKGKSEGRCPECGKERLEAIPNLIDEQK